MSTSPRRESGTSGSLEKIQALYDRNQFLQAFRQTAEYWKPSTRIEDLSISELILGSRLATRLGASRLSRWLLMTALEREPTNALVRYFGRYVRRGKLRLFDELRAFEADPELHGADDETQASWFASHAVIWASLRSFERAHECIARARSYRARDAWVYSCEADVLGYEDRWVDALKSAETAWEINPGTPYAAHSLGSSLLNLRQARQAAERLATAAADCESYELTHLACWYLCALIETLEGDERELYLRKAQRLAKKLPELAPLADRETRSFFARTQLDIAELADDHQAMESAVNEIRSPFYRKVLANLRKNPEGQRIRLPFRRAIQKHEACLPTSLASALATMEVAVDPDVMAAEITFGGTPEWAAAEWLRERDFEVRFFPVTSETASLLIKNGIGFVMTLEWDTSAHAVAIVGLDEAAGTLLVHDPQSFRTADYLLEGMGDEAPLGPRGMAAVPRAKAALLDQLLPQVDAEVMAASEAYRRANALQGNTAARAVVADLAERHPQHPVTRKLQAVQALEDGQTGQAVSQFQELLRSFPNSAFARARLLSSCRSVGNTALMRETLAGVVERGIVPGIQAQQEWRHPPAAYISEYADLLRLSAETKHKAQSLLHSAIRYESTCADAWHVLGDFLWHERHTAGALLAYRIATCLANSNEHYARAYSDALAQAGRKQEGLEWLAGRVRNFGASPHAIGTWVTWISGLEDAGQPKEAIAACDKALEQHGGAPELLAYAVPFAGRMGEWDKAETLLSRLEVTGNSALFHKAAVDFYAMRGELHKAIEHAEGWLQEWPLSVFVRRKLIDLIAKCYGAAAALEEASRWTKDYPRHDELEELHCEQLDAANAPRWKKSRLLLRRVKRNREDAWAWRELAFLFIYHYEAADETRRKRLQPRILQVITQCERTAPQDAATLRVHAEWLEARGEWTQAVEAWVAALDQDPFNLYSYRHAWQCAARFDSEERRKLWDRIEPLLLRLPGRLLFARDVLMLAAQRFGVAAAEQIASRWNEARPNDPEVTEASADLLLEYGHGRSDAERALRMLSEAVEQFPYHAGLRFSLANAFRSLGRFKEAEEVLHEIIRRHPDNSAAQMQLARVHERHGRIEEALRVLELAAERDPQNTQIHDIRVQILLQANRFEQARALMNHLLQRFPESVSWRERAIRLLSDAGDPEAAVNAAREGVVVHARGAYLWLLLASTLNENRRFSSQGEIESCLRRSLALNQELFETADRLAMFLVEQRRYAEAEEILRQIQQRLSDPCAALGRLAWIRRIRGEKKEALDDMASAVHAAPWYRWGWSLLMDWLAEDQAWEKARNLLGSVPPELRTDTQFRRQRLLLLEKAGLPVEQLDTEWNDLLRDFPEDTPLHLLRFDSLRDAKRWPEATAVLDAVRPLDPDSPFVRARSVQLLAREQKKNEAIEGALQVLFAPIEESTWPAETAWETIRNARFDQDAYARARDMLREGRRPTPHALFLLAKQAAEKSTSGRPTPQPLWRTLFPDRGARELSVLLKIVDSTKWVEGHYRATLLRQLSNLGYHRLVVGYWKRMGKEVESDIECWSEIARALVGLDRKSQARKLLAGWRTRPGASMWMVANYVLCFSALKAKHLREVAASTRDALTGLAHDHCAKYLAHLQAEASALLGDKKAFWETWSAYSGYFSGKLEENEWFENKRRHLLEDIPWIARHFEENRWWRYRLAVWSLRWKHMFSSSSTDQLATVVRNIRWWWLAWLVIWILITLSRK